MQPPGQPARPLQGYCWMSCREPIIMSATWLDQAADCLSREDTITKRPLTLSLSCLDSETHIAAGALIILNWTLVWNAHGRLHLTASYKNWGKATQQTLGTVEKWSNNYSKQQKETQFVMMDCMARGKPMLGAQYKDKHSSQSDMPFSLAESGAVWTLVCKKGLLYSPLHTTRNDLIYSPMPIYGHTFQMFFQ